MPKTILIVEDDLAIRENTAELLMLEGYQVFTASNGDLGYQLVNTVHPDIVICDILMPESDGSHLLEMMKNNDLTSGIPLVFFSAGSVPASVRKGLEQGADDYLSKPFSDVDLLETIKRHLNGTSNR